MLLWLLLWLWGYGGHDDVTGDDNVKVFGRLLLEGPDGVVDGQAAQPAAADVDDLVSHLQPAVTAMIQRLLVYISGQMATNMELNRLFGTGFWRRRRMDAPKPEVLKIFGLEF